MRVAFEDVSVVPMDAEHVVHGQTVVVDDDRITWVGPATAAQIPAGGQRIDGRGKFLMPGLADMHCHPCDEDDLLLLVAHGVTTIRNLEGMPRHVLWRERVASGQMLGPTIYTSGPIVDGRPVRGFGSLSVVTARGSPRGDRADQARRVRLRQGLRPAVPRGVRLGRGGGAGAGSAGGRAHPVPGRVDGILSSGQRSIEHLYGYPQALQPPSRAVAAPHDLGQLRKALFDMAQHAELGTPPGTGCSDAGGGHVELCDADRPGRWLAGQAALSALPELAYLSPLRAAQAQDFFHHYPTEPERFAVPEFNAAVLRGLNEAGAGVLRRDRRRRPGLRLRRVRARRAAGVRGGRPEPIRGAPRRDDRPAEFLGQAGQWGQVVAGARADLVLLDADPIADIASTTRRSGVMVRGRWLPQSEIDLLLADLAARRREPMAYRTRSGSAPAVPKGSEELQFDVTWAGFAVGEEHIADEQNAQGDRRVVATSSIDGLGTALGSEAGTYRAQVSVDSAGVDQSAWFEFDGDDGTDRVEITRVNGSVHVRHSQATHDEEVTVADPDATAVFGRPLTALYLRLGRAARRARGRRPGRRARHRARDLTGPDRHGVEHAREAAARRRLRRPWSALSPGVPAAELVRGRPAHLRRREPARPHRDEHGPDLLAQQLRRQPARRRVHRACHPGRSRALAARSSPLIQRYRTLFRAPGAAAFCCASFVQRMPVAMYPLGIILIIAARDGRYGFAGVLSALYLLGNAAGSPVLAGLADRHGQRRVLLPGAAVHAAGCRDVRGPAEHRRAGLAARCPRRGVRLQLRLGGLARPGALGVRAARRDRVWPQRSRWSRCWTRSSGSSGRWSRRCW